jgi:putative zinc finger protein
MDHAEATETMAAERYVLNEMTPEDRDAFEEHFFGCPECAEAVRDDATIGAVLRAERRNFARQHASRTRPWWLAAAAVLVIATVASIAQTMRLRQELDLARAPHLVDTVSLLTAETRGAGAAATSSGSRPFVVDFDIPPQPNAQRYAVRVLDSAGNVKSSAAVPASAAQDTQHLLVPAGALPPGRYALEIRAEPAEAPASTSSFVVR